jgi:hypothetical protein
MLQLSRNLLWLTNAPSLYPGELGLSPKAQVLINLIGSEDLLGRTLFTVSEIQLFLLKEEERIWMTDHLIKIIDIKG